MVTIEFAGEVWFWKGPAPWYFLTVPEEESREIHAIVSMVTYGWGMVPVNAQIGDTEWYTALWPKDGRYILPIKARIRKAEGVQEGAIVAARIEVVKASR